MFKLNSKKLEKQVSTLMEDPEVSDNKGIYNYVLSGNINKLSMRAFDIKQKRIMWERQKGICPVCKDYFDTIAEMDADHIKPWSKGGKTELSNGQMLCRKDNQSKSNK